LEDIAHVSENIIENQETETIRLSSTQNNQMSQVVATKNIPSELVGRVQLSEGGFIDVTDETTLTIAKSYLDVFEKKLQEKIENVKIIPPEIEPVEESQEE